MTSDRSAVPNLIVAGAVLAAATTCLTISYARAPSGVGVPVAGFAPAVLLGPERGTPLGGKEEEEEEKREELENESEKAHYAERAERAREQTERDAEAQKSSTTAEDRAAAALLRAQSEVIAARDVASGMPSDPCAAALLIPPGGAQVELRVIKRTAAGGEEAPRMLHQVASRDACALQEGFYLEQHTVPAKLVLCPTSCEWARAASHGLRADVVMAGL